MVAADIAIWASLGGYYLTGDARLQAPAAAATAALLHGLGRKRGRDPIPDSMYHRLRKIAGHETGIERTGIQRDT
ncbi:MAG: hypothetical protein SVW77_03390 [Candidatus Nanohaloarchaea archaeon]|nr:hypothetical protein [Candidatus Nanohaloarchaea archaeon]